MTTFVELHALRSFPPSNLNRDDAGTPKTAIFGGTRRLRISSQCLKRTWRTSQEFRGSFSEEQLGVRTRRLPSEVLKILERSHRPLAGPARDGLLTLLASIGRRRGPTQPEPDGEDHDDADADAAIESEDAAAPRTPHLLFLGRPEIEAVARFAGDKAADLAKLSTGRKVDSKALDKLRKALKEHLEQATTKHAVDVGLFGRFATSAEFDTVDGALQVAHALGTQKVEVEDDYYTAVDDLAEEAGAGYLGEREYASSVLYLYACCDLAQLERNLGRRSGGGREADEEAARLARRSLPAVVRALTQAVPRGTRTGSAPNTPAEYVEIVVRNGAPLSFANAFLKAVDARDSDGDVMAASISRLSDHRNALEAAYGRAPGPGKRLVMSLRDAGGLNSGDAVKTIDELGQRLALALDSSGGTRSPGSR